MCVCVCVSPCVCVPLRPRCGLPAASAWAPCGVAVGSLRPRRGLPAASLWAPSGLCVFVNMCVCVFVCPVFVVRQILGGAILETGRQQADDKSIHLSEVPSGH